MRLGLLGPADGDDEGLLGAAEVVLRSGRAERAIYLGVDDALERAIAAWGGRLAGAASPSESTWERACELAAGASAAEIDAFVRTERARLELRLFESLPGSGSRTIEMLGDRVAVLVHDKGVLNEEDIYVANLILYGASDVPVVRRIGSRWFISPGRIGSQGGGCCVLDDAGDEVTVTIFDPGGKRTHHEALSAVRSAKMRVQGG